MVSFPTAIVEVVDIEWVTGFILECGLASAVLYQGWILFIGLLPGSENGFQTKSIYFGLGATKSL